MSDPPGVLEYICMAQVSLRVLFVGGILGLLISIVTMYAFQPGTQGYVVSILNLIGAGFVVAFSGGFLWWCNRA